MTIKQKLAKLLGTSLLFRGGEYFIRIKVDNLKSVKEGDYIDWSVNVKTNLSVFYKVEKIIDNILEARSGVNDPFYIDINNSNYNSDYNSLLEGKGIFMGTMVEFIKI